MAKLDIPGGLSPEEAEWLEEIRDALGTQTPEERMGFPKEFVPTHQEVEERARMVLNGIDSILKGKPGFDDWYSAVQKAQLECPATDATPTPVTKRPAPRQERDGRDAGPQPTSPRAERFNTGLLAFLIFSAVIAVTCLVSGYFDVVWRWARLLGDDSSTRVIGQAGFVALFALLPTYLVIESVRGAQLYGGALPTHSVLRFLCPAYALSVVAFGLTAYFVIPMMGPHKTGNNLFATFAPFVVFWWSAQVFESLAVRMMSLKFQDNMVANMRDNSSGSGFGRSGKGHAWTGSSEPVSIGIRILEAIALIELGLIVYWMSVVGWNQLYTQFVASGDNQRNEAVAKVASFIPLIALLAVALSVFVGWAQIKRQRQSGRHKRKVITAICVLTAFGFLVMYVPVPQPAPTAPEPGASDRSGVVPGTDSARG